VSYSCCSAPPPACYATKTVANACEDLSALEAQATAECAQSGDVLTDFSPMSDGCPDGQAFYALTSCCPASP
jgi:hypothetical protein